MTSSTPEQYVFGLAKNIFDLRESYNLHVINDLLNTAILTYIMPENYKMTPFNLQIDAFMTANKQGAS